MNFNPAAAGKTCAVILAIWGLMFASDLTRSVGQQGVFSSEGVADKVRGVLGLNGEAQKSAVSSGLRSAGVSVTDAPGSAPVVAAVERGSIAEKSGLKAGDKITAVNRVKVHNAGEVESRYEGEGTLFIVERNGKAVYPNIVMGKVPPPIEAEPSTPAAPVVGLNVSDMVGMYPAGVRAPMAMNPAPGSLADKAGIKAGEWITAVNGKSIATAAEYRQLTEGEGPLTLTVLNAEANPRQTREAKLR